MKVCVKCPGAFTYLHPVMNFCPFCGNREIIQPGEAPPAPAPPVPHAGPPASPMATTPASPAAAARTVPASTRPAEAPIPSTNLPVPPEPRKPSAADLRQVAIDEITKATGLSFLRARRVHDAGYDLARLGKAKVEELAKIPGVDEATARRVLEALGVAVEGPDPMARKVAEEADDLRRAFEKMASAGVGVEPVRGLHGQALLLSTNGKHDDALSMIGEAKSLLSEVVESEIRGSRERMLVRMSMSGYRKADTKELREVLANIDVALSIGDLEEALELKRKGLKLVGEG
jgi:hypothetical protein